MTIKTFAESYRVRTRQDSCGDVIIPGKRYATDMPDRIEYRSHVYDHDDGEHFGVCLTFTSARKWGSVRRKLEAAGFTIRQNGDTEGIGLFNPQDKAQSRLALKLAGVRTRRELSPERREAQARVLAAARAARQAAKTMPQALA